MRSKVFLENTYLFVTMFTGNGTIMHTGNLTAVADPGEALQVTLLLPDRIRERWKDFVDELSAYYNTPWRLEVFRRQFENVHRRPGFSKKNNKKWEPIFVQCCS